MTSRTLAKWLVESFRSLTQQEVSWASRNISFLRAPANSNYRIISVYTKKNKKIRIIINIFFSRLCDLLNYNPWMGSSFLLIGADGPEADESHALFTCRRIVLAQSSPVSHSWADQAINSIRNGFGTCFVPSAYDCGILHCEILFFFFLLFLLLFWGIFLVVVIFYIVIVFVANCHLFKVVSICYCYYYYYLHSYC